MKTKNLEGFFLTFEVYRVKTFEVLKTKNLEGFFRTFVVFKVKTFEVLKTSKVKFEFKLRKLLYFVLGTLYIVLL